jgi:hypothetical protein
MVGQNKCLEVKPISSKNAERILLVSSNFFLITLKNQTQILTVSLHSRVTQLGVLSEPVTHNQRLNTRQKLNLICVTDCPYPFKASEWHDAMQRRQCTVLQITDYVTPDSDTR